MNNIYIKSSSTWIFIFYLLGILYFSSISINNIKLFNSLWKYDKLIHLVEYIGLGFLLINAMKVKPLTKKRWRNAILFLVLFPIFDELIQNFTPKRVPDIYDGIVDIAGGLIGAYLRK